MKEISFNDIEDLNKNTDNVKFKTNTREKLINFIFRFFSDKNINFINKAGNKYSKLKNFIQINPGDVKIDIFEKILSNESLILKDIYKIIKYIEDPDNLISLITTFIELV